MYVDRTLDAKLGVHAAEQNRKFGVFAAEQNQKFSEVRGEMTLMQTQLGNEIDKRSTSIEHAISALGKELPGRRTIWGAVVTLVLAIVTIVGLVVAIFNAGNTAGGIGADIAADAKQGVKRLDGLTATQQQQIDQLDGKLDKIITILGQPSSEPPK